MAGTNSEREVGDNGLASGCDDVRCVQRQLVAVRDSVWRGGGCLLLHPLTFVVVLIQNLLHLSNTAHLARHLCDFRTEAEGCAEIVKD